MRHPYHFSYCFFPVGQGLFATGSLWRKGAIRYLWSYDCGTSSSQALIDEALQALSGTAGSRNRVDLFILSHFDHDHISGVARLLQRLKVGTLVLPFMPLHKRMLLAFEERAAAGDELMRFMIDPVGFIASQDGPGVERILFVPGSGEEGPPPPAGDFTPDFGGEGEGENTAWDIVFREGKPDDYRDLEEFDSAAKKSSRPPQIYFLAKGSAIVLAGLWEFVPYNDDPGTEIDGAFRQQVNRSRQALLDGDDIRSREAALKELKALYDHEFGKSSENRNGISLFFYAGPIYPSWRETWLSPGDWHWWLKRLSLMERILTQRLLEEPPATKKCSVIYTGDGYLDSTAPLQRLIRYFHAERVDRCGLLQVMHHGSEKNWHKGVAAAINPNLSVFSSDPNRKKWGHPHAPVLRDFWSHGPVQVDKQTGFVASGYLW